MLSFRKRALRPKNILITGASSGIGAALAVAYAEAGVTLYLIGRNTARLDETARRCASRNATAIAQVADVADADAMRALIHDTDSATPLDLVIANAGVARGQEDFAFSQKLIDTNVRGTLNTVEPAVACMRQRSAGHIAIMSSLAGFRALGGPPGYAASKAWARLYGEALRGRLAKNGVAVSVICPGFVSTPMTERSGKTGMSSERAAHIIKAGLSRNAARISFPTHMAFQTWWMSAKPAWWTDRRVMKCWKAATKAFRS